jgi:hypothetical protein
MSLELEKLAAGWKDRFSAVYEVVQTVEVVMDDETYRVEIVKGVDGGAAFYNAKCTVKRTFIHSSADALCRRERHAV